MSDHKDFPYNPINVCSAITPDELRRLAWLASQMESVVEIGSWHGASTHALLSGCKGKVYAVDHFKGSTEPGDATHNESGKEDFIKNVGHFENLTHIERLSHEASKLFEDASIDMVFIDAGHMYDEVMLDLQCWYPKVKKLICGHDWHMDPVKKAIIDFGIKSEIHDNTMWEHWKGESECGKER